ncbi:MAG: hypothetical protein AVDCRST_MAG19-4482 [uncultured Thermomicrobiales bacterium]|uniref:Uncharacterized protein n=1 Tax=uncultured Thermomicrobiales bacterium TaxID=1645740 RepID=A0A6J4VQC9_9BACT|nr:MAG: hypothetical protein AVDCRST_MAG19-4482 [uncultured Thermomicrobiales bacterium]
MQTTPPPVVRTHWQAFPYWSLPHVGLVGSLPQKGTAVALAQAPQTPGVPPPPQVRPSVQLPLWQAPPQPSPAPQALPAQSGTQGTHPPSWQVPPSPQLTPSVLFRSAHLPVLVQTAFRHGSVAAGWGHCPARVQRQVVRQSPEQHWPSRLQITPGWRQPWSAAARRAGRPRAAPRAPPASSRNAPRLGRFPASALVHASNLVPSILASSSPGPAPASRGGLPRAAPSSGPTPAPAAAS